MNPDDVKRLMGGYATGTLTPAEQKALFEAALEDQELFNALAREQTLREALDDPAVRHELIERLQLRRLPDLHFTLDLSEEHMERIERLLKQMKAQKPSTPEASS